MSHIVAKYGGSSLADADQVRKVLGIVRENPARRFVVPSAPGKRHPKDAKITDLLLAAYRGGTDRHAAEELYALMRTRFVHICDELGVTFDPLPTLTALQLTGCRENGLSADYAASRGEYLMGKILAEALGYEFVDAAGLIAFDADGALDMRRTQENADRLLRGDAKGFVIPGFYGAMPDGTVKTLSRGGSDVTGAIVAAVTGASLYENWTDVDGIRMADPRILPDARKIEKITYKELRELTYMGANVLHDEATFPLRKAGIPIQLRNTNNLTDPGTLIVPDEWKPERVQGSIVGVAGRRDFTVISIEKIMMNAERGFIRKLSEVFERRGISVENVPGGIDNISVIVANAELEERSIDECGHVERHEGVCRTTNAIIADIHAACEPDNIRVTHDMAQVCVVGNAMVRVRGVLSRVTTALAIAGVNSTMVSQSESERSIIIGVKDADCDRAVEAIYRAFS